MGWSPCGSPSRRTRPPVDPGWRPVGHRAHRPTAARSSFRPDRGEHRQGCRRHAPCRRPSRGASPPRPGAEQGVACPTQSATGRGSFQAQPAAGEDGALPIERQVITELAHQHVGQERGPGKAPRDGPAGRPGLGDVIAAGAGELGAHMADHLKLAGMYSSISRDLAQGLKAPPQQGQRVSAGRCIPAEPEAKRPSAPGGVGNGPAASAGCTRRHTAPGAAHPLRPFSQFRRSRSRPFRCPITGSTA